MLNFKHSLLFLVMLYLGSASETKDELWTTVRIVDSLRNAWHDAATIFFEYQSHACRSFFTQREELLASHKARSNQLEKILLDAKQRVADHHSGTRLLMEDELTKLQSKVDVFTKKIEKMRSIPEEHEVERILERERMIKKRNDERRREREEL